MLLVYMMSRLAYLLLPLVGWVTAGVLKFCINYLHVGKEAKRRIGNGGFPSTHTTIVASTAMFIGFHAGFTTPIFSLGLALLTITVIDATGIRRTIGTHAKVLNETAKLAKPLRESQGHNWWEVGGGLALGTVVGFLVSQAV